MQLKILQKSGQKNTTSWKFIIIVFHCSTICLRESYGCLWEGSFDNNHDPSNEQSRKIVINSC